MAKDNNLKDFLTDIADAIREKKGTADKINPQDFAAEIASIEGGGGAIVVASPNDVNFFDYDGTLLHSYTWEEALAMTELPPLPEREGLICQEWNYTLDDIKAQNGKCDVGATYITDDGKTRLYIRIAAEGRMDVPLIFQQSVANGVVVDWGDGSDTETTDATNATLTHHYESIGDYCITLAPTEGTTLTLGYGTTSKPLFGSMQAYSNMLQKVELGRNIDMRSYAFLNCYSLSSIVIPKGVAHIANYAFQNCYSLASVVIPSDITSIGSYILDGCHALFNVVIPNSITEITRRIFYHCYNLAGVVLPKNVTFIDDSAFAGCYSLSNIVIPQGVTGIDPDAFAGCYSLSNIVIPQGVTTITVRLFSNCYSMAFYDFSSHEAVPTLAGTNAFTGIPSDCKIIVPDALYDEWIAATNWATYADYIIKKSDWDAL